MVLGVIAVVGHDTDHGLLIGVAGVRRGSSRGGLRAAIGARLLVVDADTDAYRFRHALIGEVVYAELLPPERQTAASADRRRLACTGTAHARAR